MRAPSTRVDGARVIRSRRRRGADRVGAFGVARVAFGLVVAAACGGSPAPKPDGAPADPAAATGRGGTARVGVLQEPSTFIDWNAGTNVDLMAADLVFRRLARPGPAPGEFTPDLAESWREGADGRSITFTLREGVEWEDAREVSAEDVVFSEARARGKESSLTVCKPSIESVEAVGPREVVFRFRRPPPEMLAEATCGRVYPKHLLESVPDAEIATHPFNRRPVGSGPFRLEAWEPKQYLSFVPRGGTEAGGARLERFVLRIFADKEAALRELEGGGLDVLFRVPIEVAPRLESGGKFAIHRFPTRGYYFLAWNARRPPWDRAEVRRALAALVDRRALASRFEGRADALAEGPVPPDHPWHDPALASPPHDPTRAAELLAAAGLARGADGRWVARGGKPLALTILVRQGTAKHRDIAAIVADALRQAGIGAEVREVADPRNLAEFDVALFGRPGILPPDLASCFGAEGAENYGRFADPALEADLAALDRETDPARARAAFDSAYRRVIEQQPWTFLFHWDEVMAVDRRLQGVPATARQPIAFADRWWIGSARP